MRLIRKEPYLEFAAKHPTLQAAIVVFLEQEIHTAKLTDICKTKSIMIISKITNDQEHTTALQRIEELMDIADDDPRMYELLYLSDLVADYEEHRYPTPKLSPLEVLAQLMEEHDLKQKDLAHIFGSKSMVSMILSGKRNMTVDKVQKLSEFFHVPSYLFIEGGAHVKISSHTPQTDPEQEFSALRQMLKSTIHEEFEKYLADPKNKLKTSR